jgi:DNA-directed RNA polymerase subunit RPC12/RpoP/rubredoxin
MVLDELPEYSTRITQEIECPFCKAKIKVLYKPSMMRFTNSSSASAGTKRKAFRTPEKYEILADKCPNCGKSKKEIERALREGRQLSNEEIIKRMKEAGLPLKIKG